MEGKDQLLETALAECLKAFEHFGSTEKARLLYHLAIQSGLPESIFDIEYLTEYIDE